jgi:hypothetical protein
VTSTVALFDWTAGGHRPTYVRRFVEALTPLADVVLALPQETLDQVGDLDTAMLSLGDPRPEIGSRIGRSALLAKEASLFRSAMEGADHAFHLYADHVLMRLIRERRFSARVSLLLYYPRAHYGTAFGSHLPPRERAIAQAKEWAVRAWRRRSDAEAVFALDEEAARRWTSLRGSRALWLPEPPIQALPLEHGPAARAGCVLWGALDERKGIDLLALALTTRPTSMRVVLAGQPAPGYLDEVERHAALMRAGGVDVDVRAYPQSELEGLRLLAAANCAILPYRQHSGMSRVLVEACSVGTPVVVHDFGLMGHLVRTHGLGLAVDCADPEALRSAVLTLTDLAQRAAYTDRLAAFADRFTAERFRAALAYGLGLAPSERSEPTLATHVELHR